MIKVKYCLLVLHVLLISNVISQSETVVSLKGMFDALNDVRKNPSKYADIIQTSYVDFIGSDGVHTVWRRKFMEGTAAMLEAMEYLRKATPLPALTPNKYLTLAAYDQSLYQNETNKMTHDGRNGVSLGGRVSAYGSWNWVGENIVKSNKNSINTATLVILEWVIDDGVSSRGHRNNIFSENAVDAGFGIVLDGTGKDWITLDLVKNFNCNTPLCTSVEASQERLICWTSFQEGLDKCELTEPVKTTGTEKNVVTPTTAFISLCYFPNILKLISLILFCVISD